MFADVVAKGRDGPVQLLIALFCAFPLKEKIDLVQHKDKILLRLRDVSEEFIQSAVGVFLKGSHPDENVQVLQKINHPFPVFTHKAVIIGKVAQKHMLDSVRLVGHLVPGQVSHFQSGRERDTFMFINQDMIRVRSSVARGGYLASGQGIHNR